MNGMLAITAGLLIIGGMLGTLTGLRRQAPRAVRRRSESAGEV
jgi:hypothetical protein